jgi:Pentapeptide repeats (9 copies)
MPSDRRFWYGVLRVLRQVELSHDGCPRKVAFDMTCRSGLRLAFRQVEVANEFTDWDDEAFELALEQAREGKIDAPNVRLTEQQLQRLLKAAPRNPEKPQHAELTSVDLRKTTFIGDAYFAGATFTGAAFFGGATFTRNAAFVGAIFSGDADFSAATFTGHADFRGATFTRNALFGGATFSGNAAFGGATFHAARVLGPVLACERLSLDGAVFAQRIRIVVSARRVSFQRAEFRRRADVRLRWAQVWLEDTDFAEESLLTFLPAITLPGKNEPFLGLEALTNDGGWCCARSGEPPPNAEPRVLTLAGSRVGRLTLAGVSLEECRFATAHGLDDLRLERVTFPESAQGWRWSRRQTIAEEHHWRAVGAKSTGWDPPRIPAAPDDDWPPQPVAELRADEIASLYRQLRKGREDSRDEPGANDFYYGEMEMRRRSGRRGERLILWAYWLVAGYGLRASRALLALAITILLGALLLSQWGFRHGSHHSALGLSYGRTLLFAVQSSISLLRASTPPGPETAGGQVIEIILRLAGPLFFGLALIALRGRVKR